MAAAVKTPRFLQIAEMNFDSAVDQIDDYASYEAAFDSYMENADQMADAEPGISRSKVADAFIAMIQESGLAPEMWG